MRDVYLMAVCVALVGLASNNRITTSILGVGLYFVLIHMDHSFHASTLSTESHPEVGFGFALDSQTLTSTKWRSSSSHLSGSL